ncbi:hypothetical protein LCGC14_2924790 [marine sediment metagenome]|uniref:Uncharacterized protein n=1 Tax=marine sediment metagenome TaxID=412755 RepID=A0A0F9ADT6_9ZZZZ
MRVIIPSNYVKAGQNIKQNDKVTLVDEGTWGVMQNADGKEKKVLQFKMKIVTGELKQYTMNNSTMRIMIDVFGDILQLVNLLCQ